MARKLKTVNFDEVTSTIEDEILQAYFSITSESGDLHLHQLPALLTQLNIQDCFISDIKQCIDYFYEILLPSNTVTITNKKHYTTLNLIHNFTISPAIHKLSDIIDIVDIDKLIVHGNRLIKFRNNYEHIIASWNLFINQIDPSLPDSYCLTLPDLKKIKTALNLDPSINNSILIDMLSCSCTDSSGNMINFDFNALTPSISIKNFAMILGNLGELQA